MIKSLAAGVAVCALVTWMAAPAQAASTQLLYGPPAAWIVPVEIPKTVGDPGTAPVQVLLFDNQSRFTAAGDEHYAETAIKILTPQGLASLGNLTRTWKPDTQTLTIHKLRILRGDRVIDLLAGGKTFTVLRREQNLELSMLDGALTGTFQIEDLRVGDIVDFAATMVVKDPVLRGRSAGGGELFDSGLVGRYHLRAIWGPDAPMRWRTTPGLDDPKVTRTAAGSELVVDLKDVRAPKPPHLAPARFRQLAQLELSDFRDWAEVSALMAPLYVKASTLAPQSPLRAEAAKIAAASKDPKVRAFAALKLVEDQTRYLFLGMNLGGYVPADADVSWSRKFGDCKGKTALLLALLRELGVEAQASLVSTAAGDGLDERLPRLDFFDHVMVRAVIGGQVYWMDGTRSGDRNLDDLPVPSFHWALPVQASGAKLERLTPRALAEPGYEEVMRFDASAGIDTPAPTHIEEIHRGENAIVYKLAFNGADKSDIERGLREDWARRYPWLKADKVSWSYDEATGVARTMADGTAAMEWTRQGTVRDYDIVQSNLGWQASFRREPGLNQDAPYAVNYPDFEKWTVTIVLPDQGAGFRLVGGGDLDKTVAGIAFKRRSRIEGGILVSEASQHALVQEFPAADAASAAAALREMASYDVVVRHVDHSVEVDADAAPATEPTDAAGFNGRGVARLSHDDRSGALKDLDRAVAMAPTVSSYRYNRGAANFEDGRTDAAIADFTEALRLNPTDKLAHLARGGAYLVKRQDDLATKDFDAALALAPGDARLKLQRADAYERAGRHGEAVALYGQWLAQYPDEPRRVVALYHSCRANVGWGENLQGGLSACNAGLALRPDDPDLLTMRALINLKLGRGDQAIADARRAVGRGTGSLAQYTLGLALYRTGDKTEGLQTMAEARRAYPDIDTVFQRMNLKP